MYVVSFIYRSALRLRIRRLVRWRVFNSARTATRNLDLPLAIGVTPPLPSSSYRIGRFWPGHGGHTAAGFSWSFLYGAFRLLPLRRAKRRNPNNIPRRSYVRHSKARPPKSLWGGNSLAPAVQHAGAIFVRRGRLWNKQSDPKEAAALELPLSFCLSTDSEASGHRRLQGRAWCASGNQ
jgi:hypothetical protein